MSGCICIPSHNRHLHRLNANILSDPTGIHLRQRLQAIQQRVILVPSINYRKAMGPSTRQKGRNLEMLKGRCMDRESSLIFKDFMSESPSWNKISGFINVHFQCLRINFSDFKTWAMLTWNTDEYMSFTHKYTPKTNGWNLKITCFEKEKSSSKPLLVGGFNPNWKVCSSNRIISPGIAVKLKKNLWVATT